MGSELNKLAKVVLHAKANNLDVVDAITRNIDAEKYGKELYAVLVDVVENHPPPIDPDTILPYDN